MKKQNVRTKEEYVAYVKCNGKYLWVTRTQAETLELCKALFAEHRKDWELHRPEVDWDDVQYRHRTVTYTDWEVVE